MNGTKGPSQDVVHLPLWVVSARSAACAVSCLRFAWRKRRTGRASLARSVHFRQPQFCVSTGARQQSSQPASIGDVI